MRTETGMIAVDWGTTNRRIYVIDSKGCVEHRSSDALGVLSIAPGEFPGEIQKLQTQFGNRATFLAGMIGSNRGWIETSYLPCPVDLDMLAGALTKIDGTSAMIVPGVSYHDSERADVMRGEEVQILGSIAAGVMPNDSPVCHPGTHAKWVAVEAGAVQAFRTVMTGELFAILRKQSILVDQLDGNVSPDAAFLRGVRRGLEHSELAADLFAIRAGILLGSLPQEEAASYASGLLIGGDIRIGLDFVQRGEEIALIGEPSLTALYAAALHEAGRDHFEIDGEVAFLAGINALAERRHDPG